MTQYMYLKSYKPCKVSLICEPGSKFMLHVRGREEFFDSSDERMMIYYLYGVDDIETFGAYLCMAAKLIPLKGDDLEVVANEFKSQREAIPIVKYPLEHIPLAADPVNGLTMKTRWGTFHFTAEQEKALVEAIQADPTREAARGYCRVIKRLNGFTSPNSRSYLSKYSYNAFLRIHGIISLRKRKLTIKESIRDGIGISMFYIQILVGTGMFIGALEFDLSESFLLVAFLMLGGGYLAAEPLLMMFNREFAESTRGRGPLFMDWFMPDRHKVDTFDK